MTILYRVIRFGENEHGFWNEPTVWRNHSDALRHYLSSTCEGAVMIYSEHESWKVLNEFGTANRSVVYGSLGTFSVVRDNCLTGTRP